MRSASISELLFPVMSLAIPPLLSSFLAFSLLPLTLLAVVSVAVPVAISVSAVFSGSVVLRSGAMFGAERSGGLVLSALWVPPPVAPVRRAERS